MLLGVIADDFTGASDIANTLVKGYESGGLRTVQFLGVPERDADAACEAGVISLKTRSIPAGEAVAQSLNALDWLLRQGCRQIVFKYCSTFDSTPEGNIGPVGEALARKLGVKGVVACPAFPTMKRTIYRGHLFVGDQPLSESSLRNHPLNPMTDSNIRRSLAQQSADPVGLVSIDTVREGSASIRKALGRSAAEGQRLVVVDAISDEDLLEIGSACVDDALITGGSGIAIGLPRNFISRGLAKGAGVFMRSVEGPEAILAGSCSRTTLEQVSVHAQRHPTLSIDPSDAVCKRIGIPELVDFLLRNEGKAPLIYSTRPPAEVSAAQESFGQNEVSAALEHLFADLAAACVRAGIRRLVVAGGETSGAVVNALDLELLEIGPEIDPGVPLLYKTEGTPLVLALKSGNFGTPDFFSKALAAMDALP
jgi:uncharacterized protein YgbK (DUF1537 family)